ncbi:MAG TPA: Gfo/Idh/MocA family oxidoreductase [Gemmatales bacterium]|nr:Gfo/Idh/MocA family oxidoreductase [Gemmatales bacterium]HMP61294.1 Gfo/Idh/MocA family oxidoreductase [Gemmatales bacterium]
MAKLRVGVVGVGHLGKEHARILSSFPDVELVGVADVNASQARAVAERCQTTAYTSANDLVPLVDAACIVVPTSNHARTARPFLEAGRSLLIEKPLAPTAAEAELLVDLAWKQGAVLQVGHIERFNPAFLDVQKRPLTCKFIQAERVGLFTGRALDVGVVFDLMIHDLDLMMTLVGGTVTKVEALGVSVFGQHEDIAHARLQFSHGCVAVLAASRVARKGQRRMEIFGPEGCACIDFGQRQVEYIQPTSRLTATDVRQLAPADLATFRERLFADALETQSLDLKEGDQLTAELRHFLDCVRQGRTPMVSGVDGLEAVTLAERIVAAIRFHAWTGDPHGCVGPCDLPAPRGRLFTPDLPASLPRAA